MKTGVKLNLNLSLNLKVEFKFKSYGWESTFQLFPSNQQNTYNTHTYENLHH